jgi:hypothetical protein
MLTTVPFPREKLLLRSGGNHGTFAAPSPPWSYPPTPGQPKGAARPAPLVGPQLFLFAMPAFHGIFMLHRFVSGVNMTRNHGAKTVNLQAIVTKTLDRIAIAQLSELLANLAWEVRDEAPLSMRPPRISYVLAFARDLTSTEWTYACARYQSELLRLVDEEQEAAQ